MVELESPLLAHQLKAKAMQRWLVVVAVVVTAVAMARQIIVALTGLKK